MKTVTFYVDMDGTIADIHGQENWHERAKTEKDFFEKLMPFSNLITALYLIKFKYGKKVKIRPLSATENNQKDSFVVVSKQKWLNTNADFMEKPIFTKIGTPKSNYVPFLSKRKVLLDDHTPNLIDWEKNNGKAVKVRNNINCSGAVWDGDIIYNQASVYEIVLKMEEIIKESQPNVLNFFKKWLLRGGAYNELCFKLIGSRDN